MNFTINGEPYTFTLQVDGSNHLTGFTATDQSTTYDCAIYMTSQLDVPEVICCTPNGCTQGGCGS